MWLYDSLSLTLSLQRCPNLLSLTLSGCGHVTDDDVISVLQSCRLLQKLCLEDCCRVTDAVLQAVVTRGSSLLEVRVDFCRNITQMGLQAVRLKRPCIRLSADRSAGMIPDSQPEEKLHIRRALQKVLLFSWATSSWVCSQKTFLTGSPVALVQTGTCFEQNNFFIKMVGFFFTLSYEQFLFSYVWVCYCEWKVSTMSFLESPSRIFKAFYSRHF